MRYANSQLAVLFACLALPAFSVGACSTESAAPPPSTSATHSSSMALTRDGATLFVSNPESDSMSVIDAVHATLRAEVLLGGARPAPDPVTSAYVPSVMPRYVALSTDERTLYVTGERASALYAVDVATSKVRAQVHVCSEPLGVLSSRDGTELFVACSQDAKIVRVSAASFTVDGDVAVMNEPWALAWNAAEDTLLVTHFMGDGVTSIDPVALSVRATFGTPDEPPRGDKRLAHGQTRGLYDAVTRPGTTDLWIAHTLLATDTAQPDLDFESTAFPALSLFLADGTHVDTLSTDAADVPGTDGAFADVVSGPRALAFTHDGAYALMVAANSEDVLVIDAQSREEIAIVRPLPGHMPDGIVISADDTTAWVDERGSADVVALTLDRTGGTLHAEARGAAIPRLLTDPMPAALRRGFHLFNSANSTEFPITTNHWIACATCHMEGRSDAVTWRFAEGPRDTPTNAGGVLGTGFLLRTADRTRVQDYWHTINVEQGGRFDPVTSSAELDDLAAYVNFGIPFPVPPTLDATLVARGKDVFAAQHCDSCHKGPRFTDSGSGNPTLDLGGPILLHDIGTCVTQVFPDAAHMDNEGHPRAACMFDTPSLNGVSATPPYLHDGSARTLEAAVRKMPSPPQDEDDLTALVEYLRSL